MDLATEASAAAEAAARALRHIARNEDLKRLLLQEPYASLLQRAAARYIGGTALDACLATVRRVEEGGSFTTVDNMGESTREASAADAETEEFLRLVDGLVAMSARSGISLDLSHIGLAVSQERAVANLSRIAAAAARAGFEVMISMEGSERVDAILEVYRHCSPRFENLGITLQAGMLRTPEDLQTAMKLGGRVRLVKGAYEEGEAVALPRGAALDARFTQLATTILRSGHRCSIATHDPAIHAQLHDRIRAGDASPGAYEFETLLGLAEGPLAQLRAWGHPTRVYVVYGREWYLYVCHRIAEQPFRLSLALADLLGDVDARRESEKSALFPHR